MAEKHWIGGTSGSETYWNESNNWSSTSGGAGGAGTPTSADDVIFDYGSQNCTVDISAVSINSFTISPSSASEYKGKFNDGTATFTVASTVYVAARATAPTGSFTATGTWTQTGDADWTYLAVVSYVPPDSPYFITSAQNIILQGSGNLNLPGRNPDAQATRSMDSINNLTLGASGKTTVFNVQNILPTYVRTYINNTITVGSGTLNLVTPTGITAIPQLITQFIASTGTISVTNAISPYNYGFLLKAVVDNRSTSVYTATIPAINSPGLSLYIGAHGWYLNTSETIRTITLLGDLVLSDFGYFGTSSYRTQFSTANFNITTSASRLNDASYSLVAPGDFRLYVDYYYLGVYTNKIILGSSQITVGNTCKIYRNQAGEYFQVDYGTSHFYCYGDLFIDNMATANGGSTEIFEILGTCNFTGYGTRRIFPRVNKIIVGTTGVLSLSTVIYCESFEFNSTTETTVNKPIYCRNYTISDNSKLNMTGTYLGYGGFSEDNGILLQDSVDIGGGVFSCSLGQSSVSPYVRCGEVTDNTVRFYGGNTTWAVDTSATIRRLTTGVWQHTITSGSTLSISDYHIATAHFLGDFEGNSGTTSKFRSSSTGTQYTISAPVGIKSYYSDWKDANLTTPITAYTFAPYNNVNSGNNTGIKFDSVVVWNSTGNTNMNDGNNYLPSSPIEVEDNLIFNGTSIVDAIASDNLNVTSITISAGTLNFNSKNIICISDFSVLGSCTVLASSASLSAGGNITTVSGCTFTAESAQITTTGINPTISTNSKEYPYLILTRGATITGSPIITRLKMTAGFTYIFEAGSTYTITSYTSGDWNGSTSASYVDVKSSVLRSRANFDVPSGIELIYTSWKDINNIGSLIEASTYTNSDYGNNFGIDFFVKVLSSYPVSGEKSTPIYISGVSFYPLSGIGHVDLVVGDNVYPAIVSAWSDTLLTILSPNKKGLADIRVTDADGDVGTLIDGFTMIKTDDSVINTTMDGKEVTILRTNIDGCNAYIVYILGTDIVADRRYYDGSDNILATSASLL